MNKSFVLERNKELGLRNIITNYFWNAEGIEEGFNKQLRHYRDMEGVTKDINDRDIKEYLKNYYNSLSDKKSFDNFLKVLKEYYPKKIGNNELLDEEGILEYVGNIQGFYRFIKNILIPTIKEI